ncbi:uncharacterized protein LOC142163784 [Nicotiana tabacum]|uniref:Uncharacterized protein LOC142163784 n=1 Tax=Nicotiana tabacum TaxID=4097 RepID=A0AC58RWD4_TOBAC
MLLLHTLCLRPGEITGNQRNPRSSQLLEQITSHMNFLWNCRGAQSVDFRRKFRSLLDYNRPYLVVLLETHYYSHQILKDDFNFTGMIEVATIGQSGEIVILWLSDVLNREPVATTTQEIHYHVQVHPFPFKFLFSVVYASSNLANRLSFWKNLMCVYDNYTSPFILGGDFNEILHAEDKFGGLSINNSRANKLLDCINYCHLTDLGYKDSRYTWTNGRHNRFNILERIDHIMANYDWLTQYPDALVTHLLRTHSDDCPIKIELQHCPLPRNFF